MDNEFEAILAKMETLSFIGGELCLDYANTVDIHTGSPQNERLTSYPVLVAWARHAGILSYAAAERLLEQAARAPDQAQAVFQQAIELREALYRIFSALAAEHAPAAGDLEILNTHLDRAMSHGRIVPVEHGFEWEWSPPDDALDQMLWPVARSAADLLTSEERERVRECDGDTCGWLFVDTSKNHSRRWCSMDDCGNRAKAQRFYKRRRSGANVR